MDAPQPLHAPAAFGVPTEAPSPDVQGMLHGDAAPMGLPKQGMRGSGGGCSGSSGCPGGEGVHNEGSQLILMPER